MLTLEQKLYQLIISRLDGEKISSPSYAGYLIDLVKKGIGGFIVFGGEKEELKKSIEQLQSVSDIPLFIASDIERGVGQQIKGTTLFPGQMAVAAATDRLKAEDVKILEEAIEAVAAESLDVGINMPLIPVLDVNRNPDNPIICTRAFSDNPEVVAWYGRIYISTLEKRGLISCAKHFPGHGDTAIDSHISLPVISKSLTELMETDIFPFKKVIQAGVSSIMIGHLSVPSIDHLPASLSPKTITGLLRKELGYDGLVLTDALNMHALNEFKNVPSQCMNTGVDIILHPADADAAVNELRRDLKNGVLKEDTIDTAVGRISKFKSKIAGIGQTETDYEKNAGLAKIISDNSITLVKDKGGLLPLKGIQDTSLVYTGDENRHDLTVLKKMSSGHVNVNDYPKEKLTRTVIFALFTSVAAWQGSSGISTGEIQTIRDLIKKAGNSIVISFGSPYVLRHFREADVLIAAYDTSQQVQSSVIKCLTGKKNFTGTLPVKLPLL